MKKAFILGILCLFTSFIFAQKANDSTKTSKQELKKDTANISLWIMDARSHNLGADGRVFMSYANKKGIFVTGGVSAENEDHGFTISGGITINAGKYLKFFPGFGFSDRGEVSPMFELRTLVDFKNLKINTRSQFGDMFSHFAEIDLSATKWLAIGFYTQFFVSKENADEIYSHSTEFGPVLIFKKGKFILSMGNLYGREKNIGLDGNPSNHNVIIPKALIPTGSRGFLKISYGI